MRRAALEGCTIVICVVALACAGCETAGQTGALTGAGIGALFGQAAGGNTEATLIGAGVGTGIGYIIGNEMDKQEARNMSRETRSTYYSYEETSRLAGSRWLVIDISPEDSVPEFTSKIIEFRSNGRIVTTTTRPNGTVKVDDERYRVVGSTLIINKPGYLINAKFRIDGDEMILDTDDFSAVLERMST